MSTLEFTFFLLAFINGKGIVFWPEKNVVDVCKKYFEVSSPKRVLMVQVEIAGGYARFGLKHFNCEKEGGYGRN